MFESHNFFKKSKSRHNPTSIWSRPCCTAIVDPNCCTEEYLHSLTVSKIFVKKELIDADNG